MVMLPWLALAMAMADESVDAPQFTTVHTESHFDIRLYRPSSWMTAPLSEISFEIATLRGFHKLFQYSQGANMNFSRIPISFPVLTGIVSDSGPFHSPGYIVRLYLPTPFQKIPPTPLYELDLKAEYWDSMCIAVRKFSGFARDINVAKQANLLENSLQRSPWANATMGKSGATKDSYTIAQYNTPFKHVGRLNEVWVSLGGTELSANCTPQVSRGDDHPLFASS